MSSVKLLIPSQGLHSIVLLCFLLFPPPFGSLEKLVSISRQPPSFVRPHVWALGIKDLKSKRCLQMGSAACKDRFCE